MPALEHKRGVGVCWRLKCRVLRVVVAVERFSAVQKGGAVSPKGFGFIRFLERGLYLLRLSL